MVYILLGKGFEEIEAIAPGDILRRGGVRVCYAAVEGTVVVGSHGIPVTADGTLEDVDMDQAEMLVVPGGLGGVEAISGSEKAMALLREAAARGIELAAICAGPTVLAKLGITDGKQATCYPGMEAQMGGAEMCPGAAVVRADRLTTGRGAGAALQFGKELLAVLRGRETAEKIAAGMCF